MKENIRRWKGAVWIGLLGVAILLVPNCDPVLAETGTVTIKAPMPKGGAYGTASVDDGVLYVAGATDACPGTGLCGLFQAYNPATDTWAEKALMARPRLRAASGVVNGIYYLAGGNVGVGPVNTLKMLEAYDPKTNSWTTKTPMPTARLLAGAAVVDGRLYVFGGYKGFGVVNPESNTVEAYNPFTDTWGTKTPMPTARSGSAVAVVDGLVYVIGGATNSDSGPDGEVPTTTTECYDPKTDTWTTRASFPLGFESLRLYAGVVDGIIYVFNSTAVEAYDPKIDTWTEVEAPRMIRSGVSVGPVGDNVYVVGGLGNGGSPPLAVNEAFSPYLPVTIRVNPPVINLKSNEKIKVAILSSSTFDATSVVPDSVKLSGALAATERNGTPIYSFEDVNGDGILDLVLTFRARNLELTKADKQVVLKGQTFGGQLIKGVAAVRIVP
jgi:N-acetylneuraminic acid mutarotase